MVGVDGLINVGEGLGLDPLRGIDDEEGAFAGGNRAAHLVREVDVTGCIDEVELVFRAVLRGVAQAYRLRLDGDARKLALVRYPWNRALGRAFRDQ